MSDGGPEELRTYRGNCHCAAYVFEVRLPEVKEGYECNCSLCHKRGGIMLPVHGDVVFVRGSADTLSTYSFGNRRFKHQSCATCGSYLFCIGALNHPQDGTKPPPVWVNLRVIQNLDIWGLSIRINDGASVPPAYTPPEFKGPEPPANVEGGKIYTGSCHCGAVTLAVKVKPLDSTYQGSTFQEKVVECDCSICIRNAYCWIYPKKPQVSIVGAENLSYYAFGARVWQKSFCRTCGVPVHHHIEDYSEAQLAAMPEEIRAWAGPRRNWSPVNLRALDGVDLSVLKVERLRGSVLRGDPYVNP
ncbi:glutathione-dependent formaldehyde-activating enzyme [Biscogniauxia mediterranea]|nr:glutathione-dependent formaldehyde-activating enzyme [Biscogniauxia mediterranea]